MLTFEETMFYAEAEGLLPTRAGRINAVIADIRACPQSEIEFEDFIEILHNHGLNYEDLNRREIAYINASIK